MSKIAFYGSIESDNQTIVSGLLAQWVGVSKLNVKLGRLGAEIVHQDAKMYLFCSSAATEPGFLLEGHLSGTLDDTKKALERLLQLCKERKIVGSFEFVQVSEDGKKELSDQFYVE